MKTSYFFSDKLTSDMNLVSIAGLAPKEIKEKFSNMTTYKDLQPPKQLVIDYKSGTITSKQYTVKYKDQLNKLNPFKIFQDLENSVLLCWEPKGQFCHRHLVADWIYNTTGNSVEEL
jgi:uncharacterized protein (DUF488 family)